MTTTSCSSSAPWSPTAPNRAKCSGTCLPWASRGTTDSLPTTSPLTSAGPGARPASFSYVPLSRLPTSSMYPVDSVSGPPMSTPFPVLAVDLGHLVDGSHHQPHGILGPHIHDGSVTVRVLRPLADSVTVITSEGSVALRHEYRGIWCGVIQTPEIPDYTVEVEYAGTIVQSDDPYRFLPTLGEIDLHLIGEGRHEELWKVLGAHAREYPTPFGSMRGVSFAVWAPNAQGVRIVGDFNFWNGVAHPMRSLGSTGIWELFVPGVAGGSTYKFQILGRDGAWHEKADPYAFATEIPPANGSVVFTSTYEWGDGSWLADRTANDPHQQPMSIYEIHLGSWRLGLSYRQLAEELTDYVRTAGFTHVEFLPVAGHPYGPSWGYQVTSYFAPTSRFGSPDDLRFLIDRLHQAGIGVIVDWVPAHFPKDDWALARFDGTPLYEHPDPMRGEHPDWGTYVFDFGRTEVRNFLVANAVFWLEEFHVDGLRVDAVASMLYLDYSRKTGEWQPNEFGGRENLEAVAFLQEMNATVYRRAPGIMTIAEESTSWPGVTAPTSSGGLGFGLKWNMGWMHD
ncbi:MAG: 1,4-alpha-glucan branching enzyme, partial [Actinobacteria bacterium]|nr:1,4-alpha-glucan branching enzyme [Actinomycetota bacterium]